MWNTIVWALATGLVTGGAWAAIVLTRRHRRVHEAPRELLAEMEERVDALEERELRLADVEERLDFAERHLSRQREAALEAERRQGPAGGASPRGGPSDAGNLPDR